MGHAPLSPSAAKRWMACAGSFAACKDLPNPDNDYSLRGTFGHDMAAKALLFGVPPASFLGQPINGTRFTVDHGLVDDVEFYVGVVQSIMMAEGGDLTVEQERRLTQNVYGTADATIMQMRGTSRHVHVLDLKLGAGTFVDEVRNEQLLIYALAALRDMGAPLGASTATLHIVQPAYRGAEPHRVWEASSADLVEFAKELEAAEAAALKPNAPLKTGEHCKYCLARGRCPALQQEALASASEVFPVGLELPRETTGVERAALFEEMSDERLGSVMRGVSVMRAWADAVEEEARRRLLDGRPVPGMKLVGKMGRRKWIDSDGVKMLFDMVGRQPWAAPKLMTPAQAEKAVPALKARFAELTVRPMKPVMVAESDPRPPLSMAQAADMFRAIDEDDEGGD